MSKQYGIIIVFVVSAVLIFGMSALQAQNSVTIKSIKDATIFNDTGANGSGINFFVGRAGTSSGNNIRRGLLAFDIENSGVPSGATIVSVTLTLQMSRTAAGVGTVNIALHRLLADWGEGASTGAGGSSGGGLPGTASTGDVTWTHRFYDTQTWMTPGGQFSSTVSASQMVGGLGAYTWSGTTQMVADVQMWLDDSGSNFGWILIGDETKQSAKRFDSRESDNDPTLTIFYTVATSIEDNASIPTEFALDQNYPNPFNPSTTIQFALPERSEVSLKIFDLFGREVATLVNGNLESGVHKVVFDATDLASGVYYYRMVADGFVRVKKLMLFK